MKYLLLLIGICFSVSCALAYSNSYGSAANTARSYYSSHSYYNSAARSGSSSYSSYSNYNSSVPSINSTYTHSRSGYSGNYYSTTAARVKNTSTNSGVTVVPFRYNTLNYTRVRNMEADPPKKYSAKCTDMGDASFCQ